MLRVAKAAWLAGAMAAATMVSVPAQADVKTGVDAWTRGDFATAVREWAGPAAQGDPDAQFNMAQAYRLGRGLDADPQQAEALYALAAAQGHVKAADNYGLLLFQRGAREEALPYVSAAASRGDPRAQYLLGIAHFNGDLVAKDWRRAYALLTLANSAGLPQARGALAQMDEYISLEDRQAAQPLAASLKAEAEAARARELAAVDLALADAAFVGHDDLACVFERFAGAAHAACARRRQWQPCLLECSKDRGGFSTFERVARPRKGHGPARRITPAKSLGRGSGEIKAFLAVAVIGDACGLCSDAHHLHERLGAATEHCARCEVRHDTGQKIGIRACAAGAAGDRGEMHQPGQPTRETVKLGQCHKVLGRRHDLHQDDIQIQSPISGGAQDRQHRSDPTASRDQRIG